MYGSKTRILVDTIKNIDKERFEVEVCATYIGDEATDEVELLEVPVTNGIFFRLLKS